MRVGILDTGLDRHQWHRLQGARSFILGESAVICQPLADDHLGHGTLVTRLLLESAPNTQLWMAQVFSERPATTVAQVRAGLAWLLDQGVTLVNCSLGLHADRPELRALCRDAARQGVIICASSPAMGQAVYPAAYPGVVAVTGDARCRPGEWSWLQGDRAEFGAPVGIGYEGGASMACARFSGLLAAFWTARPELSAPQVLEHFRQHASRRGPQTREPLCAKNT